MSAPVSRPSTDGIILSHTVLVSLTPLIPLPFVDDWVRGWLLRRMARQLADAHHLRIWHEEIRALVDLPSGNLLAGIVRGAILAPIKRILRKTFMVLAGKRIVDIASETYHRAYLIDVAFARGWCAPAGKCSAKDLRAAIDAVLLEVPVASSPVTSALRVGFEQSQAALADVYSALRSRLTGSGARSEEAVSRAVDDAEASGLGGVVASLQHALLDVPREHFTKLETALARRVLPDGIPLGGGDDLAVDD